MRKSPTFLIGLIIVITTNIVASADETPPIEFVTKWGSCGSGDGQFLTPNFVEVDEAGNVYVNDPGNNRIQVFDNNGAFLASWGSFGSSEGQFNSPADIATAPDGSVYVAEFRNYRVQKFDSEGNFLLMWGYGVATGGDSLEVCTSQCQAGRSGFAPEGIAVGPAGYVYVIPHGWIPEKFDSNGNYLGPIGAKGTGDGEFTYPVGIALDSSGNLFVADTNNHRIQKLDSGGDFVTKWGSFGLAEGEFRWPRGLAVDSANNVYVAGNVIARVQKFDNNGSFLYAFGWGVATGAIEFEVCTQDCRPGIVNHGDGGFHLPQGVAVDGNGNVFVVDHNYCRVQKFSPTAEHLSCTGFQPPMASGPVTARGNRALPLKAQLFDGDGLEVTDLEITAPPVLQVTFLSAGGGDAQDVTDDALPAGFGTEGNEFEYNLANGVWQFNLKTKNYSAAGTYTITMVSGDESEYLIDPTCEAVFEKDE
jgi:DNA-binding beta-propeller fold protein YncE